MRLTMLSQHKVMSAHLQTGQITCHDERGLMIASTGVYRMQRYRVGDFFGPMDLGIHLAF